jgi:hypothetical protein
MGGAAIPGALRHRLQHYCDAWKLQSSRKTAIPPWAGCAFQSSQLGITGAQRKLDGRILRHANFDCQSPCDPTLEARGICPLGSYWPSPVAAITVSTLPLQSRLALRHMPFVAGRIVAGYWTLVQYTWIPWPWSKPPAVGRHSAGWWVPLTERDLCGLGPARQRPWNGEFCLSALQALKTASAKSCRYLPTLPASLRITVSHFHASA